MASEFPGLKSLFDLAGTYLDDGYNIGTYESNVPL